MELGRADMDRLYVAIARKGLAGPELSSQPLAAAVFEIVGHRTRGRSPLSTAF